MTTLRLYELSGGIKNLMALMEEEGSGALTWDVALAELQGDFQEKAVNIAKLYRTWEAEEKVYQAELTRLQGRMKTAQAKQTWAKDYLLGGMTEAGIDHIKGDVVDIRLQNSQPSVRIVDASLIPDEYVQGTVTLPWAECIRLGIGFEAKSEVDKRAIMAVFKDMGAIVPGVTIEQGKHIRIR